MSLQKEATKEDVLTSVANNGVLKARLKKSLTASGSAKKLVAQHVLCQLLGYQRLVSKFFVNNNMDLKEKKEIIGDNQ